MATPIRAHKPPVKQQPRVVTVADLERIAQSIDKAAETSGNPWMRKLATCIRQGIEPLGRCQTEGGRHAKPHPEDITCERWKAAD
jgi:hypothetical protein